MVDFIYPKIYDLLYQLGITANYIGFFHTAYGVYLAVNQPERMQFVTKWLYPDIATHYNTNWKAVERNIRSVANIAWQTNPALLQAMAKHPLYQKPSNGKFIAILTQQFQCIQADAMVVLMPNDMERGMSQIRPLVSLDDSCYKQNEVTTIK